jgi:hypothetical protein
MGDRLAGSALSKYDAARVALGDVLRSIGHRINYGLAVFPGLAGVTGCEPGEELMRVAPGDPPDATREGRDGERLDDLLRRLQLAGVQGGTPTSATLLALEPALRALSGRTFVVLVTDGAPNCNEQQNCGASSCIPNIERLEVAGEPCTNGRNCCAVTSQRPNAQLSCLDDAASLLAVEALAASGIATYVVGLPGSQPYSQLLNTMAELGETARAGDTAYYAVDAAEALTQALQQVAAAVALSCEITLDYEPPDPDYVNVYFDGEVVASDAVDGWQWADAGQVTLRGEACERLKSGAVVEVQILAGCKTEVK